MEDYRLAGRDGVELDCREAGSGRPLVVLHGFMGTGSQMLDGRTRPFIEHAHRVVLPDFRGHGSMRTARSRGISAGCVGRRWARPDRASWVRRRDLRPWRLFAWRVNRAANARAGRQATTWLRTGPSGHVHLSADCPLWTACQRRCHRTRGAESHATRQQPYLSSVFSALDARYKGSTLLVVGRFAVRVRASAPPLAHNSGGLRLGDTR